ncbi:MAG: amicyanin [Candidatus Angelobacter sp. Gp1-AA117]|nr:MAG: amicyanin [Candidatus Angelobacter sp. Gp1-AA117]
MMRTTLYTCTGLFALALVIVAGMTILKRSVAAAESKPVSMTEIKIDNFSFTPASITIPAGTEVHWKNNDDIPHNVVSNDHTIKSKVLDTGDDFAYTFSQPGTYDYFCSIHPKMTARIIVH